MAQVLQGLESMSKHKFYSFHPKLILNEISYSKTQENNLTIRLVITYEQAPLTNCSKHPISAEIAKDECFEQKRTKIAMQPMLISSFSPSVRRKEREKGVQS